MVSLFEQATGIDVPDSIAGISIPDVDLGDLGEVAGNFLEAAGDMGDLVEKATQAREVVARGARTAGNCWGVIDQAYDVVSSIQEGIEPLSPLLRMDMSDIPAAIAAFTRENLDACIRIIGDVLSLGKLLEKISTILEGVKEMFNTIMETCGDIIEKCMDFVSDMAQGFAEALNLDDALAGIQDLFAGIAGVVSELTDIGGLLQPVLDAWGEANWLAAAAFGVNNFGDVKDALQRFWPAWEESQRQYDSARSMGESANCSATNAWQKFKPLFGKLCKFFRVPVPDGINSRDALAMPTVAPRGGLPGLPEPLPEEEEEDEEDCTPTGELFRRVKDEDGGLSYERLTWLIGQMGGLEEEEVAAMVEAADADGDGVIDASEFAAWFDGESICDDDRQVLLGVEC